MFITTRDVCKNCDLGLKREDCSDIKFKECYEKKADLLTFKAMLNHGIQRLSLDKYDVVRMLDEYIDNSQFKNIEIIAKE